MLIDSVVIEQKNMSLILFQIKRASCIKGSSLLEELLDYDM